jgi:vacuolar-type H+-ATPase subunit D/Vma8
MKLLRRLEEHLAAQFVNLGKRLDRLEKHLEKKIMATFEELMATIESEGQQRATEVQAISAKLTEVQDALDALKAGQQGAIDAAVQQVLDEQSVKLAEAIVAVEAIVPDAPVEPAIPDEIPTEPPIA